MHTEIAVVGGGLGGLVAATICARAGRQVHLFERASSLGGRASTAEHGGYFFNQGAHAFYRAGAAEEILAALDIVPRGTRAPTSGALLWKRDRLFAMPVGFVTLASTAAIPARSKIAAARILYLLDRGDLDAIPDVALADFIDGVTNDEAVRRLVHAAFRLATYSRNASLIPARAAVRQLRRASHAGVLYLDHGWQPLVDALAERARSAGVTIHANAGVTRIDDDAMQLESGTVSFDACIVALPPIAAARVAGTTREADAILASCLDIAVSKLPNPKHRFAIGLGKDEPYYFNVQSMVAPLAPPGGALISVAEYLLPDARGAREPLERIVDALQPGWRAVAAHTQFLPKMVVAANHPGRVLDARLRPHVFGAGDGWGTDMLVDGALESARAAAKLVCEEANDGRRAANVA